MRPNEIREQSIELFSAKQVDAAIVQMGHEITQDFKDKQPLILCVVVGGIYVTGQLMPHLKFTLRMNYIHASRYQGGTLGHTLSWKAKPTTPLEGQHILLVDDILDEGITLAKVKAYCLEKGAASVKSAVLIDKKPCRHPQGLVQADYTGLQTDDHYLFGCGLDCHEYLRNEPAIYAIPPKVLANLRKDAFASSKD